MKKIYVSSNKFNERNLQNSNLEIDKVFFLLLTIILLQFFEERRKESSLDRFKRRRLPREKHVACLAFDTGRRARYIKFWLN